MKLLFARCRPALPVVGIALCVFGLVAYWADHSWRHLGRPALITGWWLFGILLLLGAFNARKKLSALPLGKASSWLRWHVVGGFLVLALFWLHARTAWPFGLHERVLTAVFYLVNLSGIIGWLMQRAYPRALSDATVEVIYERIPTEVALLRAQAESRVLACTQATGSDTLGRYYADTLQWFFRQPRFFWNHALGGGKQARAWVRKQCAPVRLYLNESERACLDELEKLADRKTELDFHFAAQSLMKRWLVAHLPLAALLVLLAVWHLALVLIYAV